MITCIFAYTEPTVPSYPGYINVSEQPDGSVLVTVRERGSAGTRSVSLVVPKDAMRDMAEHLLKACVQEADGQ